MENAALNGAGTDPANTGGGTSPVPGGAVDPASTDGATQVAGAGSDTMPAAGTDSSAASQFAASVDVSAIAAQQSSYLDQIPAPSIGRIIIVTFPGDGYDGQTEAPGIVTKVVDGKVAGVHVFGPNGGADIFVNSPRHIVVRDSLAETDPERNLPAWFWPPRV